MPDEEPEERRGSPLTAISKASSRVAFGLPRSARRDNGLSTAAWPSPMLGGSLLLQARGGETRLMRRARQAETSMTMAAAVGVGVGVGVRRGMRVGARGALLLLLLVLAQLLQGSWAGLRLPPRRSFFLRSPYTTADQSQVFHVRQVPGDGGCLFHSLASCIAFSSFQEHMRFDGYLRNLSSSLRELAVSELRSGKLVHVEEQDELMESTEILNYVAKYYNQSAEEYCASMLRPGTWGGGPEIVALSNHLRCPIHVYALTSSGWLWWKSFRLQLIAKFGSPHFNNREPLCLLNADGRFPDLRPGAQRPPDHFLALFPCHAPPVSLGVSVANCPHLRRHRGDLLYPDSSTAD